jgi:methionyl-tRNA formyltransferase
VRLVFAGTPTAALPALDALIDSPRHEVVAVVTRPDKPAGRGRRLAASAVKQRAVAAGIDVLQPGRPSDAEFLDQLSTLTVDCCPVVAYGALLPAPALALPRHGWVNLHFSPLPAWRGAAPVQHAILAGDEVTGASTFRIEEGLDTGPVFGMVTTEIGSRETAGELLERLAKSGAGLLLATMDGIEDGTLVPRPQPTEGVSLAPKITVADARIDWSAPALRVDRLSRACWPAPGSWTTFRGQRLKLGPIRPIPAGGSLGAGVLELRGTGAAAAVVVGTGSEVVEIGEVRPEGKTAMSAAAWARGARVAVGERFE